MYLAGILGLCALLHAPASGRASGGRLFSAPQSQSTQSQPEPAQQDAPKPEPPPRDPPKSDAPPAASQETKPAGSPEPAQTSPNQPAPAAAGNAPANQPAPQTPSAPAKKRRAAHQKRTDPPAGQDSKKKVVRHGGTAEPTTQLAPGITEEQAARQRETTNQLLSSTDVALQKLDGRQLSGDQKETVAQIRKFMEQAKVADADGDPQRSYKLALKAHLLSDALDKH